MQAPVIEYRSERWGKERAAPARGDRNNYPAGRPGPSAAARGAQSPRPSPLNLGWKAVGSGGGAAGGGGRLPDFKPLSLSCAPELWRPSQASPSSGPAALCLSFQTQTFLDSSSGPPELGVKSKRVWRERTKESPITPSHTDPSPVNDWV